MTVSRVWVAVTVKEDVAEANVVAASVVVVVVVWIIGVGKCW